MPRGLLDRADEVIEYGRQCPLLAQSGHAVALHVSAFEGRKRPPVVRLGSSRELWILRPVPYLHEEIPEEAENARQSFMS